MADDFREGAGGDDPPAVRPSSGTEVYDVIPPPYGFLVVFHDNHRIALVSKFNEGVEQHRIVAAVQTDRRFVKNIADPPEVRTELRGKADSPAFASAQGGCGTVQ